MHTRRILKGRNRARIATYLNPPSKVTGMIVALDIGGTKLEGALFQKSKLLKKKRIYFPKASSSAEVALPRKELLSMITGMIDELSGGKLDGVGISIPYVIDNDGKIIGYCKLLALSDFALGDYLRNRYMCRVTVNNDADCLAYGEAKLGAGKGKKNVVGIIWGTGIGSGIVLDGNIYSGSTGSAGEFGHNIVNPAGPVGSTGIKGEIEAYAGGPFVVRNYLKFGGKDKLATGGDVFRSKEAAARKAADDAVKYLCMGLAGIMNTLNPEIIVMGGGLSNLAIYPRLNRETRKYTMPMLRSHVKIVKNKLGDSGGIYGAALLAQGR
jgi:predicted NBD/HSP70 family sugar kinase